MLKSGDKLQFVTSLTTPATNRMAKEILKVGYTKEEYWEARKKFDYKEDDILELIEPTGQAPFGYQSHLCNWIVKCKHFSPPQKESIWSAIWSMMDSGILKKV